MEDEKKTGYESLIMSDEESRNYRKDFVVKSWNKKTGYGIRYGKILVRKIFSDMLTAYKWAEKNYKGNLNKVKLVKIT